MHLDLYYVDMKYIRDLSKINNHLYSVSPQVGKENRPFLGIVTILNDKPYCIPLTSPKDKFKKKSQIDFIKIFDESKKDTNGAPKLIGVLNINDMIPVNKELISKIDLNIFNSDTPETAHYKQLMQKQIRWCRDNSEVINNRANKVYRLVTQEPEKNRNLIKRCSDFKKLEAVLEKYISKGERAAEKSSVRQSPYSRKKMNEMSQKVAQEKSNRNEHSKDISRKKNNQSL